VRATVAYTGIFKVVVLADSPSRRVDISVKLTHIRTPGDQYPGCTNPTDKGRFVPSRCLQASHLDDADGYWHTAERAGSGFASYSRDTKLQDMARVSAGAALRVAASSFSIWS
jgi:hypothetical protein